MVLRMNDSTDSLFPSEMKVWCANRQASLNLSVYYYGKHQPLGSRDVHYPFSGQPSLMAGLRPAIEAYANTISPATLSSLGTYFNALLTFLHLESYTEIGVENITTELIATHAMWLKKSGISKGYRAQHHSIGNRLLDHLHARSGQENANLIYKGEALKYPTIKQGSSLGLSKFVPLDLEPYVKSYCLQVINEIDKNPFNCVAPEIGYDREDPAHVLYDYLNFSRRWLNGEVKGTWAGQKVSLFPWKTTAIAGESKRAIELGRSSKELWCGGYPSQLTKALFPTPQEVIASVVLITLDVGWVDAAKSFSFEGNCFTTFAKDPDNPKGSEYVALTPQTRPKTRGLLHSRAVNPRKGGAWWALKRMQNRSVKLRAICEQRAALLSEQLKEFDAADPAWDDLRLKQEFWADLARLSFIYISKTGKTVAGSSASLDSRIWTDFFRHIPENARFEIPDQLKPQFANITHYDFRHVVAHRTLKNAGFLAVKSTLGHVNSSSTLTYLTSHHLKKELFETYAEITGLAWSEVDDGFVINSNILQERLRRDGALLSENERQALGGITLHGARCHGSVAPPPEAGSENTEKCIGGSCVRCPAAVWNWHDDLAIPLAVEEYARLKEERSTVNGYAEELEVAAWQALLRTIPEELRPRVEHEFAVLNLQGDTM